MKTVAVDKTYNLLLGEVLETFPDRVRVDRSWLYGAEGKRSADNHIMLTEVNIVEMSDEDFAKAIKHVHEVWDANMKLVLSRREEWKKTWQINNPCQ